MKPENNNLTANCFGQRRSKRRAAMPKSPKASPRKSPKASPRKSPKASPRKSPKASPKSPKKAKAKAETEEPEPDLPPKKARVVEIWYFWVATGAAVCQERVKPKSIAVCLSSGPGTKPPWKTLAIQVMQRTAEAHNTSFFSGRTCKQTSSCTRSYALSISDLASLSVDSCAFVSNLMQIQQIHRPRAHGSSLHVATSLRCTMLEPQTMRAPVALKKTTRHQVRSRRTQVALGPHQGHVTAVCAGRGRQSYEQKKHHELIWITLNYCIHVSFWILWFIADP